MRCNMCFVSCAVHVMCLAFALLIACNGKPVLPDADESWKYFMGINSPPSEAKNLRGRPNAERHYAINAAQHDNITLNGKPNTATDTLRKQVGLNFSSPAFAPSSDRTRNVLDINDFIRRNFPRTVMTRVSRYFRKPKPCRTISFRRRLHVPGCLPVTLKTTACIGTSASVSVPSYAAGLIHDTEFCSKCTPVGFTNATARIFCKSNNGQSNKAERISYMRITKCVYRPCSR